MSEYADRDAQELDKDGGYYCRHVMAMTAERLHSKRDIACELAYRDKRIDELELQTCCPYDHTSLMNVCDKCGWVRKEVKQQ
jgi:hypothetical protein